MMRSLINPYKFVPQERHFFSPVPMPGRPSFLQIERYPKPHLLVSLGVTVEKWLFIKLYPKKSLYKKRHIA